MNDNRRKIGWCDKTVNPIVGCKGPKGEGVCRWCYAKRMNDRFHMVRNFSSPRFFPERLKMIERCRKPSRIFIDSMSDLFGEWAPKAWRERIFNTIRKCPQHTFQALTKNPEMLPKLDIPENLWVGVSITNPMDFYRLTYLRDCNAKVKFLSMEPLLATMNDIDLDGIDWVIVGAMTGPTAKKYKPNPLWIMDIFIKTRMRNIPLFIKSNLKWPEEIKEFPCAKVEAE